MNAQFRTALVGVFVMAALVAVVLVVQRSGSQNGGPAADFSAIETGADHIDATALADRIMARDPNLLLIDVRPEDEFAVDHLPGAVRMSVPEILSDAQKSLLADPSRTVVLYSNGPTHPGQAWMELHRRGVKNVFVLDGGLEELKRVVLTPPSLLPGATEATVKAETGIFQLRRAFFLPTAGPFAAGRYAKDPQKLTEPGFVSTKWLAARGDAVRIVDVRESRADFDRLHIKGSVHLPVKELRVKAGDRDLFLRTPQEIADRLGGLGISNDSEIVVVTDDKFQDATMAAIALLSVGHRALAILEGGIAAWAAERLPLVQKSAAPVKVNYLAKPPQDDFAIKVDAVAKVVADKSAKIVDVRPPEAFAGKTKTEARSGHIPGSVNRPFADDLLKSPFGGYIKKDADLFAAYRGMGIEKSTPVIVSCRTGHQASATYFLMKYALGFENVRWYNGSFTEWASKSELPVE